MEWTTVQHLDLRHVDRSLRALQPHAAAFHPNQAFIAAAIGTYVVEFDALTGSKISSIDIGAPVVRMLYSPTSAHAVIAMLEVPRGADASTCYNTGLAHLELNQLSDALSCFDEAFLALAKDQSHGADIKAQATICAQYKIAVALLQEIGRLQKVHGASAISAKDEMARLSRHLGSLPLKAKHCINCIRTAIKRNMEVQNYTYSKQMLELLLSKSPPSKLEELRTLADMCIQRGLTN